MSEFPHTDRDPSDPREPSDPSDERGGRRVGPPGASPWTSCLANVVFMVVLWGCAAGILRMYRCDAGLAAVTGVSALSLATYLTFRRSFERVGASDAESLMSWMLWTVLIAAATACYVLDWRILGALTLGVTVLLTFVNTYVVVMRPDVVDRWVRRSRERDLHDPGRDPDDDDPRL